MKRILFVATHYGSQLEYLCRILESQPRIQFYQLGIRYKHPTDLAVITSMPHKDTTQAAIYCLPLLENDEIIGKSIYKCCQFIYFLRRPLPALTDIINQEIYSPKMAIDYYVMRIRRLFEMAIHTPGAVCLTWDDLHNNKGLDLITDYLGLMKFAPLPKDYFTEPEELLPRSVVEEADKAYEGILYRMRKLNLRMV